MEDHSRLPELRNASMTIADDIRQIRSGEGPWGPGYRAAQALRNVLGIATGDTFGCFSEIAGQLGAGGFNYSEGLSMVNAVVSRHDDVFVHLRNHAMRVASTRCSTLHVPWAMPCVFRMTAAR